MHCRPSPVPQVLSGGCSQLPPRKLCYQPQPCPGACPSHLAPHPSCPQGRTPYIPIRASCPLSGRPPLSHPGRQPSDCQPARTWHFPEHKMPYTRCKAMTKFLQNVHARRACCQGPSNLFEQQSEPESGRNVNNLPRLREHALKHVSPCSQPWAGSFMANLGPSHPVPPFRRTNLALSLKPCQPSLQASLLGASVVSSHLPACPGPGVPGPAPRRARVRLPEPAGPWRREEV